MKPPIGVPTGQVQEAKPVDFSFRVQWTSLFVPADFSPRGQSLIPVPRRNFSDSAAQWEMVVPRMDRASFARRPRRELIAAPETKTAPPAPPDKLETASCRVAPLPEAREPEAREFHWWPAVLLTLKFTLTVAGIMALAVPLWLWIRPVSPVQAEAPGGGWIRELSSPLGAAGARKLVLYRPSLDAADFRLEFHWKTSPRPLAWIFRVKDRSDYYAMQIRFVRPTPSATFSLERFTVYLGVESAHSRKLLFFPDTPAELQIRLEADGEKFQLYLDDRPADSWTDRRLAAGGLGFLEQPGRPVAVQSVRVWFSPAGGA